MSIVKQICPTIKLNVHVARFYSHVQITTVCYYSNLLIFEQCHGRNLRFQQAILTWTIVHCSIELLKRLGTQLLKWPRRGQEDSLDIYLYVENLVLLYMCW